jgi:hypothetical protein
MNWSKSQSWDDVRESVIKRDDHECRFCGTSEQEHQEEHGSGLHAHHIIPESDGGVDRASNLITVCNSCHRTLEETHAKAMSELQDTYSDAEAGATLTVKRCWNHVEQLDKRLSKFKSSHPVFADEFNLYEDGERDGIPIIESGRLSDMLGTVDDEWAFVLNWGYKWGIIEGASPIENWIPDAVSDEALEESELPEAAVEDQYEN